MEEPMPDNGDSTTEAATADQAATDQQATKGSATEADEEQLGDGGKRALEAERVRAKEAEARAKAAEKALETAKRASMSEAEKAVAEAEARGRSAATQELGKRLATSEIRAAAGEANAELKGVFDYLDLGRFVGEDGEPDARAIKAFVDGLPKRETGTPSFDGGVRTPAAKGGDMNQLLRQAAGRA